MSSNPPASSSTSASKTAHRAKPPPPADDGIDKLLDREALALQREMEITRILRAFKLNPYEILDMDPDNMTPEAVKKKYRQLSLFIHPDKTPDPRAPDAFDLLKKAEAELSDEKKRETIDAVFKAARNATLKTKGLPITIENHDPRLKPELTKFKMEVKAKVKEMLIEEEVRRRTAIKVNLANEGTEQRMKEAEVSMKKRKAEDDARWEEGREARVGSWRDFSAKPKKKKKASGPDILG